jgi:hypothetical protein
MVSVVLLGVDCAIFGEAFDFSVEVAGATFFNTGNLLWLGRGSDFDV